MSFTIKTPATIKNLNIRAQGKDDNKITAIDIKFEVEAAKPDVLAPLLGQDKIDVIKKSFWDKDGVLLHPGIASGFASAAEFADEGGVLKIFGKKAEASNIHKFHVTPKQNTVVDLSFTVTINTPTNVLVDALIPKLMEQVKIEVTGQGDLFAEPQEPGDGDLVS